eukprot:TRINITY_DN1969_c0_g1_i1.p1 TRINITY_DN1969_c0_g1~~TRINITY_DN1969_c0_g1_i1.p1  ORF type:complete len:169 (+),score=39.52 TRINITY_DN1969_c0_g1_i1:366-872(+)
MDKLEKSLDLEELEFDPVESKWSKTVKFNDGDNLAVIHAFDCAKDSELDDVTLAKYLLPKNKASMEKIQSLKKDGLFLARSENYTQRKSNAFNRAKLVEGMNNKSNEYKEKEEQKYFHLGSLPKIPLCFVDLRGCIDDYVSTRQSKRNRISKKSRKVRNARKKRRQRI